MNLHRVVQSTNARLSCRNAKWAKLFLDMYIITSLLMDTQKSERST